MGKIQKQNRLMLEYGGRQYMTRTFKMEDGGTAVVAGLELLDILQPRPMEGGDDGFRDDGARRLYEKIDYFFDDGSLAVLTDDELLDELRDANPELVAMIGGEGYSLEVD